MKKKGSRKAKPLYSTKKLLGKREPSPWGSAGAVKRRMETDLLFLGRDILGYKRDEKRREGICDPPDPVHVRMVLLDDRSERFHMGLYPRFTYKTTIRTICKAIQRILRDPDDTILIVNEVWGNARRFLKEIKYHLYNNETLRHLYGDFRGAIDWNRDWINIKQRKNITKEPSISTAGTDVEVTSTHPRHIILDDLVGPKTITTSIQKQKTIDYINECLPLVGTSGTIDISATRWAFDDAYQYLIDNWVNKMDWDGNNLFAFDCMAIEDEQGNPIMPSKFGKAQIAQLKDTMPLHLFACQMENNPLAHGNSLVKYEDVLIYDMLPKNFPENYDVFITVDPAISLNPNKCYTGIVCGIPVKPNLLYIDEALHLKVLPSGLIENVLMLIEKYDGKVRCIGIEETAFQKIYSGSLINELRKKMSENPNFRNIWVRPLSPIDNKHKRIHAMEYYFRHHQIYIREGTKGLRKLLEQVYHYPHLSEVNLDMIDALAYFPDVLPATCLRSSYGIVEVKKKREDPFNSVPTVDSIGESTGAQIW